MINMIKKSVVTGGFAVVLAGCVTSSGTNYHIDDPYQFFNSAGRSGGFPVVLMGQPYPGRQSGVEAAIVDGFGRNFSTYPKPVIASVDDIRTQRLVVIFNMPGRPLPLTICQRPGQIGGGIGASAGATVEATAVYCGGAEPYSSAWISLPAPSGPETAEFRDAMTQLIREALPREMNPSRRYNSPSGPGIPG